METQNNEIESEQWDLLQVVYLDSIYFHVGSFKLKWELKREERVEVGAQRGKDLKLALLFYNYSPQ